MARVSAGGAATIQGTSSTPRPTASTAGALYGAEVRKAKIIALVLFGALVLVHAQKGD